MAQVYAVQQLLQRSQHQALPQQFVKVEPASVQVLTDIASLQQQYAQQQYVQAMPQYVVQQPVHYAQY